MPDAKNTAPEGRGDRSPTDSGRLAIPAVLAGWWGLLLVGLAVALYWAGYYGDTFARLEHDHSVIPPASVAHIRSGELFSTTFVDSTATVSFDLDRADLAKLLAQIKWDSGPLAAPPTKPGEELRGMSKEGNAVVLEMADRDQPRVHVNLTTYWN